eukprot:jgi/Ulvmu1/12912/UM099_0002.1
MLSRGGCLRAAAVAGAAGASAVGVAAAAGAEHAERAGAGISLIMASGSKTIRPTSAARTSRIASRCYITSFSVRCTGQIRFIKLDRARIKFVIAEFRLRMATVSQLGGTA